MNKREKWWYHRIKNSGRRITVPRKAVLDILHSSLKHLSVKDIYFMLHKQYPGIGLTTIYRTLELFNKMGILHKFDFGDGIARYEMAEGPDIKHHHHLICNKCLKVIDYDDCMEQEVKLFKQIEDLLSKKYNFQITLHQVQFYGICSKCMQT